MVSTTLGTHFTFSVSSRMNFLSALPDSLMCSIISEWLDVLHISRFDSAFCSTKCRENFLDVLSMIDYVEPCCISSAHKVSLQDLFTWLERKDLALISVTFCSDGFPMGSFNFCAELEELLEITYQNKAINQYSWLHRVLDCGVNLQSLTMYDEKLTFSLVRTITENCTQLRQFKWINETDMLFDVTQLPSLLKGLPKVEELVLIKFMLPEGMLENCINTVPKVVLVTRVNQPNHAISGVSSIFLGQNYQNTGVNLVYRLWYCGYSSAECFAMLSNPTWFTPITSLTSRTCTGVEAILKYSCLSASPKPNVTVSDCAALTEKTFITLLKCPYIGHLILNNVPANLQISLVSKDYRGIDALTVNDFKYECKD